MHTNILNELRRISLLLGLKKEVLTMEEFCLYAGISKNYVYRLTASGKIKFYRPFGKMIYFRLDEVVDFLSSNEKITLQSRHDLANNYLLKSKEA